MGTPGRVLNDIPATAKRLKRKGPRPRRGKNRGPGEQAYSLPITGYAVIVVAAIAIGDAVIPRQLVDRVVGRGP